MRPWPLALLLPLTAWSQDPGGAASWAGKPIAQVSVVFAEGVTSDDNLQPLLQSRQDDPLDLAAVRRDVATLFRVGQFRAVEADVAAAPYLPPDGDEIVEGVVLTYEVFPAPRVSAAELSRSPGLKRSEVLDAARISVGQSFYADLDATPAAERVEALYRRRGWPEADVDVVEIIDEAGELTVLVRVDPGTPEVAERVSFTGELPVPERRLRRWARAAGVAAGRPVSTEQITTAQAQIRARLARLRTFPVQHGGWVEARVTPAPGVVDGERRVVFTIEPGRRLVVEAAGLSWRGEAKVLEALSIDERTRLTRGFVAAAPERVDVWLQERGYLEARADVSLVEDEDARTRTLRVAVDRGPRHVLGAVLFEGNAALDDATLRAVMEQESDAVIGLRRVTEGAVRATLPALREVYRAAGHLDAEVRFDGLEIAPRRGARAWFTEDPARVVSARLSVREGPLTSLRALSVRGAAPELDLGFAEARAAAMADLPYSPQRVAALAQAIVEAHRAAGYLEADARVGSTPVDGAESVRDASIDVRAGPQVLLRSVVTRGVARTRASTVRREVALALGEPVTSGDLDQVRRSLYDLGIFRSVSTDLLGDGAQRDLVISVEERPRWAFELGAGVSTDQGFRGFGRATRRNLWGRAHRLGLYGLLGVDWRSDSLRDWNLDLTDPEWRAAITYDAPHFPTRAQQLLVDVLLRERVQERTWQMSRSGFGAAVETRLGRGTTLRAGARLEGRRFEAVDVGALLPGEAWTDLLHADAPVLPTPFRLQDAITLLFLHDRRDSPFSPTRGWSLTVRGELAPGLTTGAMGTRPTRFAKADVRVSGFVPVGAFLLRLSGDAGHAEGLGGSVIPLEDRYRLGGTGNLRGFRRDTLGPRNEVRHTELGFGDRLGPVVQYALSGDPTRWAPTGGDTRAVASAELVTPLPALGLRAWDGWAAALFVDAGNVWLLTPGVDATSELEPTASVFSPVLRYAVGAGMRVSTPVGPLQVDLAANPAALRASGARKELLGQQWDEPGLRAHLSLGTLF